MRQTQSARRPRPTDRHSSELTLRPLAGAFGFAKRAVPRRQARGHRSVIDGTGYRTAGTWARFHSRHYPGGPRLRARPNRGHAVPAGTERLSAHRAREIDLPEFWRRPGIRRTLPFALR